MATKVLDATKMVLEMTTKTLDATKTILDATNKTLEIRKSTLKMKPDAFQNPICNE
jgi:hypothetical protein